MKSSGASLPEMGEDISLPAKRTGIRMNIPKPDIVVRKDKAHLGAEGQNCIIHDSLCSQQSCRNQKYVLQKLTKKEQFIQKISYMISDSSNSQSQTTGYRDPQSKTIY